MHSFWQSKGIPVSISVIKGLHQRERQNDKGTRSVVAGDSAGATVSNLFSLEFDSRSTVHRYVVDVAGTDMRNISVRPQKVLKLFGNRSGQSSSPISLSMPSAVVAVGDRIYSRHPIPDELLRVRPEMLDRGWRHCRLRKEGEFALGRLEDDALQPLVNRILPWSASQSNFGSVGQATGINNVRERDGKIVCTTDSITVEGIRVFEGVTAHALYVNGPFADAPRSLASHDLQLVTAEGPVTRPITFQIKLVESAVNVRNRVVITAIIGDASGDRVLRIWDTPNAVLVAGALYSAVGLQAVSNPATGQLELAATASTSIREASVPMLPHHSASLAPQMPSRNAMDPRLMLRLDTKCTVASESSLWEEILHHFGPPPYTREVQRQINQAAEAMPVVTSSSLRHGVVKILNFSADNLNAVPLHDDVRKAQPFLEQHQPLAILDDYTIWPLQMLHCCFDPHMRAWQDIAVSACSFFPRRRVEVLNRFRQSLTDGLASWGITAAPYAASTSDVSILAAPKSRSQGYGASRPAVPQPSHRIFVGVPGARASDQQREMCWGTASHISQSFHGSHLITAEKEVDAMAQLEALVRDLASGRNPNAIDFQPIVVIFTTDRESRACRWMLAQSLRLGCIPIAMPAVKANKVKLLAANCKLQMGNKMRLDPIGDSIDISATVPSIRGRNVLCVGIDTCHVASSTVGAMTGIMLLGGRSRGPATASMLSNFWRVDVRGQELQQVADNFRDVVSRAEAAVGKGNLHEVVVLQDGSVFSELQSMRRSVPEGCGLTFTCLHKRTHIRFHHEGNGGQLVANNVRGTVVQALTPSTRNSSNVAPSFYIQSHDSAMSTARTLQVTLHCSSPTLPNQDLHQLLFSLSHAASFVPTKLPLPTRCAHKLAAKVERLTDADPSFTFEQLKESLRYRLWFL